EQQGESLGPADHLAATGRAAPDRGAVHRPSAAAFGIGDDVAAVGADVLAVLAQQRPLAVELAYPGTYEARIGKRLRRTAGDRVRIAGAVRMGRQSRLLGAGGGNSHKKHKEQGFPHHLAPPSIVISHITTYVVTVTIIA